jgi:GDP-D-mannose dehydratase
MNVYHLLFLKGPLGEADNAGSSRESAARDLFGPVGREARVVVELEVESSRMYVSDVSYLVADTSKVRRKPGWETETMPKKAVREMRSASIVKATER